MENELKIIITAVSKGVNEALNQVSGAIRKTAADMNKIQAGTLSSAFKTAGTAINQAMTEGSNAIKAFNQQVGNGQNLIQQFLPMIAAVGAAGTVKGLFDAAVQVESLNKAFKSITGSTAGAKAELDYLKGVSDKLGVSFYGIADSYKGIAAAAKGTKLEGEGVRNLFEGIVSAGTVLGASTDQLGRVFAQLGQGIGRTRFELEDLKTISEALPGVGMQDFAKSLGVTTEQFLKMVSAGEVIAEDFIPKLSESLKNKFGQAAIEAAGGAQQAMSRLTDAWINFKNQIASSGFLDMATGYIKKLTEALKDPAVINSIKSWANALFGFFDFVGKSGAAVIGHFKEFFVVIGGGYIIVSVFDKIKTTYMGLQMALATTSLPAYIKHVQAASTYTDILTVSTASLGNALTVCAGAFAAFYVGWKIGTLISDWKLFKDGTMSVGEVVQLVFTNINLWADRALLAYRKLQKASFEFFGADTSGIDNQINELQREIAALEGVKTELENGGKAAQDGAKIKIEAEQQAQTAVKQTTNFLKDQIEEAKKRHGTYKDDAKALKMAEEEKINAIKNSVNEQKMTQEQGKQAMFKVEAEFYAKAFELAKQHLRDAKTGFGAESQQYKDAKEEMLKAESAFADAKAKAIESGNQQAKAMLDADTELQSAQLTKRIAEIEGFEAQGIISAQEAAKQKIQAEIDFLSFKVDQTRIAMEQAAGMYLQDSAEYKKAVAEKISAEAQLKNAQNKQTTQQQQQAPASTTGAKTAGTEPSGKSGGQMGAEAWNASIGGDTKATNENTAAKEKNAEASEKCNKKEKQAVSFISARGISTKEATAAIEKYREAMEKLTETLSGVADKFAGLKDKLLDIGKSAGQAAKDSFDGVVTGVKDTVSGIGDLLKGGIIPKKALEDSIKGLEKEFDSLDKYADELIDKQQELTKEIESATAERAEIEKNTAEMLSDIEHSALSEHDKYLDNKKRADEAYAKANEHLAKGELSLAKEYFLKAQDYAKELIRDFQDYSDKILAIEQTTADRLRDIQQNMMTDEDRWTSDRLEAQRLYDEAVKAMQAGQYQAASDLMMKSQELYAATAREVKDGAGNIVRGLEETSALSTKMISLTGQAAADAMKRLQDEQNVAIKQGNDEAMATITKAGDGAKTTMDKVIEGLGAQQAAMQKLIDATMGMINQLVAKIGALESSLKKRLEVKVDTAQASVKIAALTAMIEQLKAGAAGQYEKMVTNQMQAEENRRKGFSGQMSDQIAAGAQAQYDTYASKGAELQAALDRENAAIGMDEGVGETEAEKKKKKQAASVGRGYSEGGKLPGFSTTDSVPAMLSWGERIMNAVSTSVWDGAVPGFMDLANRVRSGSDIKALLSGFSLPDFKPAFHFAAGGIVSRSAADTSAAPGQAMKTVNFVLQAGKNKLATLTDEKECVQFLAALENGRF